MAKQIIEIVFQPVPFWPSLSHIEPVLEGLIKNLYPQTKKIAIDLIVNSVPKKNQTVWFFLPSSTQALTLDLLQKKFRSAYDRPRAIFFLNGEGSKLAFTLFHFKNVFRNDDQFFVSCESEKQAILKWTHGLKDRLKVCPYPIDRKIFNYSDKTASRQSFHLPKQKKLILYSGRISEQKNIFMLLDFLSDHPELNLVLAGDVDSLGIPHLAAVQRLHFPFELAKKILEKKLTDRIHFIPFQSQRALANLMRLCDFQISLSTHYGEDFGYSIAQGLACGLPTILTSWGGHRTWLKMKSLGLIKEGHPVHFIKPKIIKRRDSNETTIQPMWGKKTKLPNGKMNGVGLWLDSEAKIQIRRVVEADFSSKRNTQSFTIDPRIVKYWQKQTARPSQFMYSSTRDPLYKEILKFYGAEVLR